MFGDYQEAGRYSAHCVIHSVGKHVFEDSRYQKWLGLFEESTYVGILNHKMNKPKISYCLASIRRCPFYSRSNLFHINSICATTVISS